MYLPKHFEETDRTQLHAYIAAHPLGLLITPGAGGVLANPLPFMLQAERGEHGTLVAHIARANPLWRELPQSSQALVVFQGAQAYVSPNWYRSKKEHGKVVPTWNYTCVQARGVLQIHDDRDGVQRVVTALTARHEAQQAKPWGLGDAPPEYIEQMLAQIIAIELPVQSLVGKFKFSQNRGATDRAGVEAGLTEFGQHDAAAEMARLRQTGSAHKR
jgi:transcriptional regulator